MFSRVIWGKAPFALRIVYALHAIAVVGAWAVSVGVGVAVLAFAGGIFGTPHPADAAFIACLAFGAWLCVWFAHLCGCVFWTWAYRAVARARYVHCAPDREFGEVPGSLAACFAYGLALCASGGLEAMRLTLSLMSGLSGGTIFAAGVAVVMTTVLATAAVLSLLAFGWTLSRCMLDYMAQG